MRSDHPLHNSRPGAFVNTYSPSLYTYLLIQPWVGLELCTCIIPLSPISCTWTYWAHTPCLLDELSTSYIPSVITPLLREIECIFLKSWPSAWSPHSWTYAVESCSLARDICGASWRFLWICILIREIPTGSLPSSWHPLPEARPLAISPLYKPLWPKQNNKQNVPFLHMQPISLKIIPMLGKNVWCMDSYIGILLWIFIYNLHYAFLKFTKKSSEWQSQTTILVSYLYNINRLEMTDLLL